MQMPCKKGGLSVPKMVLKWVILRIFGGKPLRLQFYDSTAFWSISFVKTVSEDTELPPSHTPVGCTRRGIGRPSGITSGVTNGAGKDSSYLFAKFWIVVQSPPRRVNYRVRSRVVRIVPFRRIFLYHVQKNPTHLLADWTALLILLFVGQRIRSVNSLTGDDPASPVPSVRRIQDRHSLAAMPQSSGCEQPDKPHVTVHGGYTCVLCTKESDSSSGLSVPDCGIATVKVSAASV